MGESPLFASYIQGGFEASAHTRHDGVQLDLIAATRHDLMATHDYELLQSAGILTVRDALRWHLIEASPGYYDWSSFLPMLRASKAVGVQVIWDLCHYGYPDWLDIWSPHFIDRFAAFAAAVATLICEETDQLQIYSPMNEISFWAWAGGDLGYLRPCAFDQASALKKQLVRATIAAIEAVRLVDPRARFVHPEPVIHVVGEPNQPRSKMEAELVRLSQYEAFDMLAGRLEPHLGGREDLLDIIGLNFYWNNQWRHGGQPLALGAPGHRPFHEMLKEVHHRYQRPLLVSETGAEGASAAPWLSYIAGEVCTASRLGVPVLGICLYPIMDYPGWDDLRHCECGVIGIANDWHERFIRTELKNRVAEETERCLAASRQWPYPSI